MLSKPLDQITLDDFRVLIDQQVSEGKHIEYKKQLWRLSGNADQKDLADQRIEFLKDVSSFANTGGGHLLVGIEEEDGKPVAVPGIEEQFTDNRKGQLTQLLQAWIRPRVSTNFQYVDIGNSRYVLVIQVDASTTGPHRVDLAEHCQFYSRDSRGAFRMDVDELRVAFTMSQMVAQRVRDFRRERVRLLDSSYSPVATSKAPMLILHFVPQSAFTSDQVFTVAQVRQAAQNATPLGSRYHGDERINLDGILYGNGTNTDGKLENIRTYVQFFYNGILEAVNADIVHVDVQTRNQFWISQNEVYLLSKVPTYIKSLEKIGVQPPIWIFASLCEAGKIFIAPTQEHAKQFDRALLLFPEIRLADYSENTIEITRKIGDMIWNAAGYEKCHAIDDEGKWVQLRNRY